MALIPVLAGQQKLSTPRGPGDVLLDFATGFGIAILENDIWEMFHGPGYYVTAFPIPGTQVNIGYDDIFEGGVVPLGVALMPIPGSFSIAAGMAAGVLATKVAEVYGNGLKLQIIPHDAPQTQNASVAANVAAKAFPSMDDNQMRIHKNPIISTANRPAGSFSFRASSTRFSR